MSYNGLTNQGLEYLTRCQVESKPVVFSKVKIGNGNIPMGSTGETTTDLYSFKKEIEILNKEQVENSIKMEILINNFDVLEEFYVKEIGVYVMDNDVEKLYWYINKDRPSPLPDKNTPAKHKYILHLETSQMESIILNYTGTDLLVDKEFVENKIKEKIKIFQFSSIAELQTRKNLSVGDIVDVLGYCTAGDGTGHKRIISDIDDGTGIKLSNGLYANLVKEQSAPLFYETFLKETRGFVAHRGYSLVAPENTLPAYQKAYENNIFIWETDLEMTSDGHFVLMHDDTVDRTTDGTGRVDSLTLEEVKRLNIDGGANATTIYDGTKVPTFEEWLSLAKRLNCYPFIELKRLGAEEEEIKSVVDIIKKYNMEERTAFISCEKKVLEKVRKFSFKIQVWWIADDITQDTINWCKRTGNAHLDPSWKIVTKEKVLLANSQGVNIAVWTVNDIEDAHKLFDMGVNLVASDWLSEVY